MRKQEGWKTESVSPEGCRGCWVLGGKPVQVGTDMKGESRGTAGGGNLAYNGL